MSENNNIINNNMWKNQYQNYNQAQNMLQFFQFQQTMMENMAKSGGQNPLVIFKVFKEEQITM